MSKDQLSIKFKIMLLGNSGVGKTTYSQRLFHNKFDNDYLASFGCDYNSKVMPLEDGTPATIELWDTAGQERFISIPKNLIKKVDGIILMYDITQKQSLLDIMKWMHYLNDNAEQNLPFLMVGNKRDLPEKRKVSFDEAKEIALMKNSALYEISCKDDVNIKESFNHAVSIVSKFRYQCALPQRNTICLDDPLPEKEEEKKCCS